MKFHIISAITLAAIISYSCSAVKQCAEPQLDIPEEYTSFKADSLTIADVEWWRFYGDSTLCRLISQTLEYNKDMLAAAARVERFRQTYRISKAGQLPEIGGKLAADYETNDYFEGKSVRDPEFDLKFSVSWEIDLWGNLRWAKRKGQSEYLASVEDERALRMTLISEVASAYYTLTALDDELDIVRNTLAMRNEGLKQAKLRYEGGLTSETVYQQAQVEYASAAALVPELEHKIKVAENAIALLMGKYPNWKVERHTYDGNIAEGITIPESISSELLMRRPDVRASEQRLKAAMSAVGIAWADRFPRLTIGLTGGLENDALKGFFRSPFSYVAGALAGPIFSFGRKQAKYKAAIASYDEARYNYEKKVLEVFKETDDAVSAWRKAKERVELKRTLRDASYKYMNLSRLQYRSGSVMYLDVLDAQRHYLEAQISLGNAIRDEHLSLVYLYKTLGGGWNTND
ncbi:MAG: efflux transporter outer membrane subunit [Bacteroidales bacterium]|nr:efflux transporter outer membrane subunit [Bacteroidales bacterium]MDE6147534.1 efflux transporter outer membrane subunit [Bacteroidales bacterium]